ncbi:MAG: Gfo/Idh/MocA family oxidoreductase [Clostridia bacterium]|nr:Gfo/Idh/MocA family oxidoreductase [Clostridia bacterium]
MFRVGIIGVGNMGSGHLKNFIDGKIKGAKITALCDIDRENLYKHKDKLDADVRYFESSDELINSGTVDGVVIATPHYDHPTIAVKAFNAGLHVFCEKPAGVYTKQVREMNEAAQKSGKVFQVNFVLRTNNTYRRIKELMDQNAVGSLKRVTWIITTWYRTQSYFNSGGWRATWAGEGGGTLLNQNPHQLDLFQWFCGVPKRVRGFCYFGKNRDIEVEDEASAYFEYDNGAVGIYTTSVSECPGTNRLEIVGDRGKLVYENDKIKLYKTSVSDAEFNKTCTDLFGNIPYTEEEIEPEKSDVNEGQAQMISNWVDAAVNGAELIAPGYEGINSLSISNAMHLSTWNDDWVELPLDEDEFYNKLQEKIKGSTYVKKTVEKINADMNSSYSK